MPNMNSLSQKVKQEFLIDLCTNVYVTLTCSSKVIGDLISLLLSTHQKMSPLSKNEGVVCVMRRQILVYVTFTLDFKVISKI